MSNTASPLPRADLAGQRILFFCPRFFSYENDIAQELRSRGAHVDLLPDRPFRSPFFHLAARTWRSAVLPVTDGYYRRRLRDCGNQPYDQVFVVNGQTVSRRLLAALKRDHPAAKFTLYMWDSLTNRRSALELLPLFDRAFSFEPSARRFGFRLRPLFFSWPYASGTEVESRYAVSFIGTAHSDRYPIVQQIDAALPLQFPRFWYLYLKARWVLDALRLTSRPHAKARPDEFRFDPLSRAESLAIFWQSRAVLDIEHPCQEGLTMRTFEALGAGKKLVTTNRNIVAYRLYDPARVCVIDRNEPKLPLEFLADDADPLQQDLREIYSIGGWIDEIFGDPETEPSHLREDGS